MISHIVFFKLKPEVDDHKLEEMVRSTRSMLLRIPEVLSVKCGKSIEPDAQWPFFIALDFESLEKLAMAQDDPIFLKFHSGTLAANAAERLVIRYEMEPGKSVKYS